MNLEELTDAVLQKLGEKKPRALLIGDAPMIDHNYNYVNEKPYEAVVLGRLAPGQLLHMPSDAVCCALMEQIPVYYDPDQTFRSCKTARALCRELAAAEQRLYRLGVLPLQRSGQLLTAARARDLVLQGKRPASNCRMTPLARDILEGKEP
ncbi:MAG: hypothetical protein J6J43_00505 [Oscillospiraceae bacterium]|nr:hypothetical protein [Oscillospiraceae bacterium]